MLNILREYHLMLKLLEQIQQNAEYIRLTLYSKINKKKV